MPETKLKIKLMRYGKVLTTHNAVVKAKGDLESAVHDAFTAYALRDTSDCKIATTKNPRKCSNLFSGATIGSGQGICEL